MHAGRGAETHSAPPPSHPAPGLGEGFEQVAMGAKGSPGEPQHQGKGTELGHSAGSGDKSSPASWVLSSKGEQRERSLAEGLGLRGDPGEEWALLGRGHGASLRGCGGQGERAGVLR